MTNVQNFVNESVNGALGSVTGTKRWFSRIIAVGSGSSAYYSAEALETTGPNAFPIGTKINTDHQSWRDEDDYPAGSVRTLIGVIATTPVFMRAGESLLVDGKTNVADMDGLYAVTEYVDEWAPFVEQVKDYVGLSIHAQYFAQEENYTDSGQMIIDGFVPSPINTVDLVTVPGAKGAILTAMESFKNIYDIMDTNDVKSRKDEGMTPEEITEAMSSALKPLTDRLTKIEESLKAPEVETPEVDEADKTDVAGIAEAVAESALPKAARQRVYAAVESGVKVDEAVAAEKTYIDEIKKDVKGNIGNVMLSNDSDDFSPVVTGWSE